MDLTERFFQKRQNLVRLRVLDKELDVELREFEHLRRDHSEKLELVRRLVADLKTDHIVALEKLLKKVEKLVAKDKKGDTKLEKIFWRVIRILELMSKREKLDEKERELILAIRQRMINEKPFIDKLVKTLREQLDFFKSSKSRFTTETQLIKRFLELVSEEGRLWGYESNIEKQVEISKKLAKEFEYYELASKSAFPDVFTQEAPGYGVIAGTLYFKKRVKFKAGIVIAHGFKITRARMQVIARRLADLNYLVYTFDIPGHGESVSTFQYGLLAGFITDRIKFLRRKFGVLKVGVIGYSVGAVGAIFSTLGYSQQLEREIYVMWKEYLNSIRTVNTGKRYLDPIRIQKAIAEMIRDGIKRSAGSGGKIDALVLASPPDVMQTFMPPTALKAIAAVEHIPFIGKRMLKGFFKGLKTRTYREMADYFSEIKNVKNYLDLINWSAEKDEFIREYKENVILKIPKLVLIGRLDLLVQTILPWRRRAVGRLYYSTGNCTVKIFRASHPMGREDKLALGDFPLSGARIGKSIIEFFKGVL